MTGAVAPFIIETVSSGQAAVEQRVQLVDDPDLFITGNIGVSEPCRSSDSGSNPDSGALFWVCFGDLSSGEASFIKKSLFISSIFDSKVERRDSMLFSASGCTKCYRK
jgi:hypothetical protein